MRRMRVVWMMGMVWVVGVMRVVAVGRMGVSGTGGARDRERITPRAGGIPLDQDSVPACRHGDDQDGARATASAVVARCDRIRAAHLVAGVDADPGVIPAAARVEGVRAGDRCIEYPKGVGGRVAIIVWQAGGTSGVCISAVKLASPGRALHTPAVMEFAVGVKGLSYIHSAVGPQRWR